MTGPITGPAAPYAVGLGIGTGDERAAAEARARGGGETAGRQTPGDGAATGQNAAPGETAAPALRIAAELLRLARGSLLQAIVGGPDEQGRPTLVTSAGLFTPETPLRLPPPGTPVTLEVGESAELLSAILRAPARGQPDQKVELRFLGGPAPAPEDGTSRPLYQALQTAADGSRQAMLALRLGVASNPAALVLAATVTGRRQMPDGSVSLTLSAADGSTVTIDDAPPGLGTGARLMLEIAGRRPLAPGAEERPQATPLPSLASAPAAIRQFAAGRTAIAGIAPLMGGEDGTAAALGRLLPGLMQGGDQTLATLLLSAALRFRDLKRLVGEEEVGRIESRDGPGPLLRAGAEFGELARAAAEPAANGWRSVPLPFFDGRDIIPLVVFVQRHAPPPETVEEDTQQTDRKTRGGATRFIVELSPSELGPLQIDGFAQGGRVDTVLRSRRPMPADLREGLTARYGAVLAASGLAGTIGFQVQEGPLGTPHLGSPAGPARRGGISITA
ncbi:hypothetical protein [Zavarzinia aquatilis]|uniref:Uncharacterized protein n=1 Tax=Zavarzinia aquatilis TaxID=2211142 RepID=A0A317DUS7_9PROT|nr:hypothetical protein [Zavarzinia aquatilis]PWR18391.1 hypothetical protein DKG74_19245 [Zavarzinia aquatilis]